ncbi:insulinase family protein [Pelagibacteraceae bacterium]|nr:insulinase family protein [Pelagibacteraceae bacterium]
MYLKSKIFLAPVIFVLFFSTLRAENEFPIDKAITYGKLDNGFTYYIRENEKPKGKAYIKLVIKAGSVMEEENQLGLAHLLEHMAFNGSTNYPKNALDKFMSSIGLDLGSHYNATTGHLKTVYEYEIPTDDPINIATTIKILADISNNLTLEGEAFEREKKIVEEEWRSDLGASKRYLDELLPYLYKGSRLLERKPIGDIEIIRNFEYDDARSYYKKWYQPNLMGLFVIGDVDVNEIKNIITESFSSFENNDVTIPNYKIPNFKENQFFKYQDEETERITFDLWEKTDFKKLNNFDSYKDDRIYNLVSDIYQRRIDELLEKNELTFLNSGLGNSQVSDLDEYKIVSVTLNEAKINEGIIDFLTLIKQIEKFGFLNSELDLAKKNYLQYLKQNIIDEETRSSESYVNEYQRHFLNDEMISSTEDQLRFTKEMLPSITIQDLNNYFKKYIQAKNQIISIKAPAYIKNLPNEAEIKKLFNEVNNKAIKPYEFQLKEVELIKEKLIGSKIIKRVKYPKTKVVKLTLKNGPEVYLKKTDFKKDEIQIRGFSSGGLSRANDTQYLSAKYLDDIISQANVGELTVSQKENLYPTDFVELFPFIDGQEEGVKGYSNNEHLEDMFKLLYVNFTDLRITQTHVDIFKEKRISQYNIDKENPDHAYNLEFVKKFFNDHPRTRSGTEELYNQINLKDLQDFYIDRFKDGGNFNFVIVGDFEFDEIEPLIEKYIGSLPSLNRKDGYIDRGIRYNFESEEVKYEQDDPKKAYVTRLYNKEFKNTVKERYKSYLLYSIIDKMFFDQIREKDNLVYSISANHYFNDFKPIELISFYLYYGADPNNVDQIDKKINIILDKVKKGNFDLNTFEDKKLTLINDYKSSLESNSTWLSAIHKADKNNLYLERMMYKETIIKSITKREITQLAKKYFNGIYFSDIQLISE